MPCYQGTGLGCPVALLAGFPSKTFMKWHMQYGEGTASKQREHVANKALRRWQNQTMGH